METPLEIAFHNLAPSAAVKADIEKRVAKLEKLHGRLIACRVSVEARSKSHRTGNIYEVHIEMQAPRGRLVVSREPHHAKERRARADNALNAVRDAFKAAEMKLVAFNEKRRKDARHPPTADALKPV